jgi:hypothetical protein
VYRADGTRVPDKTCRYRIPVGTKATVRVIKEGQWEDSPDEYLKELGERLALLFMYEVPYTTVKAMIERMIREGFWKAFDVIWEEQKR